MPTSQTAPIAASCGGKAADAGACRVTTSPRERNHDPRLSSRDGRRRGTSRLGRIHQWRGGRWTRRIGRDRRRRLEHTGRRRRCAGGRRRGRRPRRRTPRVGLGSGGVIDPPAAPDCGDHDHDAGDPEECGRAAGAADRGVAECRKHRVALGRTRRLRATLGPAAAQRVEELAHGVTRCASAYPGSRRTRASSCRAWPRSSYGPTNTWCHAPRLGEAT